MRNEHGVIRRLRWYLERQMTTRDPPHLAQVVPWEGAGNCSHLGCTYACRGARELFGADRVGRDAQSTRTRHATADGGAQATPVAPARRQAGAGTRPPGLVVRGGDTVTPSRLCAAPDCMTRFTPAPRQRYCGVHCARAAKVMRGSARTQVLYPPAAPAAQHVCQICRRRFVTQVREQACCSLACAERAAG